MIQALWCYCSFFVGVCETLITIYLLSSYGNSVIICNKNDKFVLTLVNGAAILE